MAKVNVNRATREELVEAAGLRPQMAEAVLRLRDEHGGRIADLEALKEIRGVGDATVDHLREVLVAGRRPDEGAAAAPKKAEEETAARKDAEVTTFAARSGGVYGARKGDDVVQEGAEVTAMVAKAGADTARKGAEVTAFAARSGGTDTARKDAEAAHKAAHKAADVTAQAAESGAETARKGAEVTAFAARSSAEAARRTAEQAAEAGRQAARAGAEGASRFVDAGVEQARRAMGIVAEAERRAAEQSSEAASDLGGLFVGLVSEQARHNVETFRALVRARSFPEAVEVQNGYLRASVERATRGTTRYVEVVSKLAAGMAAFGRGEARKAA